MSASDGSTTPAEELEAAIWHAMRLHEVQAGRPVAFVEHLLALARGYAAGDDQHLTALRRRILYLQSYAADIAIARRAKGGTFGEGRARIKTIGLITDAESGTDIVVWDDTA